MTWHTTRIILTCPATTKLVNIIKQLPPDVRKEVAELTFEDFMLVLARARLEAKQRAEIDKVH